ncbi:hypothetical protein SJDPG2_05500 [Porphyromonas gingivalis SJD2]|uniref:hypothetical protein n=1 Tax=Porphyromonas gingivalis TaxID=837 RepID=UPI0003D1A853|nr:hypothetical protein [Porphyromonas gingivalis]ETA26926.1 hypothetical protein SJDPG2_05500 [Porphyromonas gingivalis SJD2]MDH7904036.1 hypothetical protein [Porphyromonas gingivalis]OWR76598.1 hypothetical protein SJDPG5_07670 [Porphyromonas gingivalis SJD5]
MVITTTAGGLARQLSKIVHSFDVEMERTKYKRLTLDNETIAQIQLTNTEQVSLCFCQSKGEIGFLWKRNSVEISP